MFRQLNICLHSYVAPAHVCVCLRFFFRFFCVNSTLDSPPPPLSLATPGSVVVVAAAAAAPRANFFSLLFINFVQMRKQAETVWYMPVPVQVYLNTGFCYMQWHEAQCTAQQIHCICILVLYLAVCALPLSLSHSFGHMCERASTCSSPFYQPTRYSRSNGEKNCARTIRRTKLEK